MRPFDNLRMQTNIAMQDMKKTDRLIP